MKRIVACILSIILTVAVFAACQNKDDNTVFLSSALGSSNEESLSPQVMKNKLMEFLNVSDKYSDGDLGVREPFSEKEKVVADRLFAYGESFVNTEGLKLYEVERQSFSVSGKYSQNIIIKKNGTGLDGKKVIIGANYDNIVNLSITGSAYDAEEIIADITKSLGAMENGTGCALIMALIDHYKSIDLPFDLVFVFFGAGSMIGGGAAHFVNKMSELDIDNTLLMINLKRFGGDNIYLYTEEVKTVHNDYISELADSLSLSIKSVPKNTPLISAVSVQRIPYTHWAMVGGHSPFMNAHINVANVFSGNLETLSVSDLETAAFKNRTYTIDDTFQNLESQLPHYKEQMSSVAKLIVQLLNSEDFASVMTKSRAEFVNYDIWTNELIAMIVLIGLIIVIGLTVFFVSKHFEKKYPFVPQKMPNLRVAVFGTDYEDKNSEDIIIDFKKPEDPFGG